ncbi:MAG: hypothetical protein H6813_00720 [Phycisphaeraceae bacterium]|nr:hypothetical protein [Phycisphaeraceae bacterium]MCB9847391.1 hypothetical protein [Phycisphaeraceae bacterium]
MRPALAFLFGLAGCSILLPALTGCAGGGGPRSAHRGPEAVSLLGRPLTPPTLAPETRELFERRLALAQAEFDKAPENEDAIVWLGRRTAYLGRYREAIGIYTRGLALHPESARLLRHRGHRALSLRRFNDAVADLTRAAALTAGKPDVIEPDGLPNARNEPRSTLQGNIWYHLGVALYCKGDYGGAADAFDQCLKRSTWNDDMLVATTAWLYRSLRREGRDDEAAALLAPIHEGMDIIENGAYLRALLFAKGELPLERALTADGDGVTRATLAYGVAAELMARGDSRSAIEILRRIVRTDQWAAFGFIAAEADLARMGLDAGPVDERTLPSGP